MQIAIIGPGGLGCLFAVFLRKAGHNVFLLDRDRERAAKVTSQGVVYFEGDSQEVIDLQVTADPEVVRLVDLVLLCVKSHDTFSAIKKVSGLLKPETLVLAFQNGIGHHKALFQELLFWGAAVTAMGASMCGPGQVRLGGRGQTSIGFVCEATGTQRKQLRQVASLFNDAGLFTSASDNMLAMIWNKLLVNVGINALSALHDCPNGELLKRPELLDIQKKAVLEAANVARLKGIAIASDPIAMVHEVCRSTQTNISSMLQDIRLGRQTEIEAINGAVVKEAAALHVDVSVNAGLYAAVKELELKKR